jgi:hypothetical protein
MSNIPALFMSGPRLKLVIDGVTVAHAVGFDVNVRKTARHFHTLGEFGPVSVGTLLFNGADGSLQIQQLNPFLVNKLAGANATALKDQKTSDTDATSTTSNPHIATPTSLATNNSLKNANSNLRNMFDPSKILLTSTFVIEVWQAYPMADGTIKDIKQMEIHKCRLNGHRMGLSLAQLTTVTFGFEGTYAKVFAPDINGVNVSKIVESDSSMTSTT